MTLKRKMKNALFSLFYGLVAFILAMGAMSILGACVPAPAIGAVALAGTQSSCLTPESAARADSGLNLALVQALDEAAAGSITGEELTLRLRDSLVTYGEELRTAIVTDTATAMATTIGGATQKATEQGGAIGAATALLAYAARELSWRTKRKPALQEKAEK